MNKHSSTFSSTHSKTSASSRSGSILKAESASSAEEGQFIDYEEYPPIVGETSGLPPKTGEYYYQDYKYVSPTQSDFDRKQVQGAKLFEKKKKLDGGILTDEEPKRDASILVTGFGMRNVESFQQIIHMSQEERKKWELRKLWREQQAKASEAREEERRIKLEEAKSAARTDTTEIFTTTETRSTTSSSDLLTQTDSVTKLGGAVDQKKRLDYLMGLETAIEEGSEPAFGEAEVESEDEFKYSTSKSIREAQRYLRRHRIFECFQFIIAHLLSANAENPIEFILNLINKCLLYRSGLGEPPLLYEKKHIDQLFNLMDRLQSGFIDMEQYKTGMKTLGICTFNESPEMDKEDEISRETFVEEVYEAELAIFNDLIKRRPEKSKQIKKKESMAFDYASVPRFNPPYFIPSDLFKFSKQDMVGVCPDYSEG